MQRNSHSPLQWRRILVGIIAGSAASPALFATRDQGFSAVIAGLAFAVACALTICPIAHAYIDSAFTAGAFAVPVWGIFDVFLLPILSGRAPQWTAEGMRTQFPALVGWLLFGLALGVLLQLAEDYFLRWLPQPGSATKLDVPKTRILILGGGFAGVTTAQALEREIEKGAAIEVTVVSETNALLFTPMLAEVAASSIEPTHIASPLRTSLRQAKVVKGRVTQIDFSAHSIQLNDDRSLPNFLDYDHLVLALGAVSLLPHDAPGIAENAFEFKTLQDAMKIRNHVISLFDRADNEQDPQLRRGLLTFVIAGGGFSGAELAGALNDFARGMLDDYPNLPINDLQIFLVHSRDRILPELSHSLADYAKGRMEKRGVTFRLNARVKEARHDSVTLDSGDEIPTHTLIWTAGSAPNPLLEQLPVERDKRGSVVVESTMALPGQMGIWALGDCAALKDVKTGAPCPPTAQFAIREAPVLARNICATIQGSPLTGFHFDALGTLCVVGHHTACAEIKGLRFSGLFAWVLWRGIYVAKLPGLERKVRVLIDWLVELFFPRDITQTLEMALPSKENHRG